MLLPLAALAAILPAAHAGDENTASVASSDAPPAEGAPAGSADPAPSADEAARASAAIAPEDGVAQEGQSDPGDPKPSTMERRKRGKGDGKRGDGPDDKRGDGPAGDGPRGDGHRPIWANIRPVGLLQVWGTAWDMDQDPVADATGIGDPEDDVGFKVKRFRLGLRGAESGVDWALVVGTTAPYDGFDDEAAELELIDAHLGYARGGFGAQVGRDEVPFSRDRMMGSAEQAFQERGMIAEHIAPGRELGATVWGEKFGAKITLGVFNSGGDLFGDDNLGKTLLGRVEYGYGDANLYETWGGPRSLGFGVGGGAFYTDDVATSTLAFGADAILRVSGLTVMVDAALATVSPTNTTLDVPGVWDETTRRGLTGHIGYGIGAFEPAVKISLYEDSAIGGYNNVLAGVIWHGALDEKRRDRVRIGAGYALRLEEDAIANDTVRVWAQVRP